MLIFSERFCALISFENVWNYMNEVISNPLPRGGKTMNCKQINLDPPIRIKTTHNEYLSCSPDQGQQFLGLGFLI